MQRAQRLGADDTPITISKEKAAMQLKHVNVRPMFQSDEEIFDQFRRAYWEADLEIPKGFKAPGIETAVASDAHDNPIASLTGTMAIVMDPLIKNPDADPLQLVTAIYMLERTLAYLGQKNGAVDAYIAIPNQLVGYHKIVEKAGYIRTVENCTVYRRALMPDTQELLGTDRDRMLARTRAAEAAEVTEHADTVSELPTESEDTAKAV
jgi:hypothetical protein